MLTRLQAAKMRAPPKEPRRTYTESTFAGIVTALAIVLFLVALPTYITLQFGDRIIAVVPTWLWILLLPPFAVIGVRGFLTVAFLATAHR